MTRTLCTAFCDMFCFFYYFKSSIKFEDKTIKAEEQNIFAEFEIPTVLSHFTEIARFSKHAL